MPNQSFAFDANDQLTTDTYDANGNTLTSPANGPTVPDVYDHANRLVTRHSPAGVATFQYDGDGNRVGKSIGGVTMHFMVDEVNPTGWPQVLEEQTWNPADPLFSTPAVTRVYSYGHAPLSQDQLISGSWSATHFGHDAHGNVRYLSDATGRATDTFDYDAFGNLIAHGGTTPATHLFTGEEFDSDLGLYNLRARYHNPSTGRFWTRDSFEGYIGDPSSSHGYSYAQNNPINFIDPGGHESLAELTAVSTIAVEIGPVMGTLWGGINSYSYGLGGGGGAGPDGKALLAKDGVEGLFIQGLSPHQGINLGQDNFFTAMKGAPFLLAANPFVFALRNDCFQYEALSFDANAPVYGCPNKNPVFTFDFANDPMFKFAEGMVDPEGAARGVGRGASDLVKSLAVLGRHPVAAAEGLAQTAWDLEKAAANNLTVSLGIYDAKYAQELYGESLDRLEQQANAATGGADAGFAERVTYTATQYILGGALAKVAGRVGGLAKVGLGRAVGKLNALLLDARALRAAEAALEGATPTLGSRLKPAALEPPVAGCAAAKSGGYNRIGAIRDALSDANGELLSKAEREGIKFTIRRVEDLGYQLEGAIKYAGNQGIDLAFSGGPSGRFALAEAKAGGGLGTLSVDSLRIRQGSFDFFSTRLQRAGRIDLLQELNAGNVDLFGGFAGSGRLFQFDPNIFVRDINFRTTPGAAKLIP